MFIITFDVSLKINSGCVKLVLVDDKENELIIVCDQNVFESFEFSGLKSDKYKLKLVGDNSTFDLDIIF